MFLFPPAGFLVSPPNDSVQTANDLNGAARQERSPRQTTAACEDRSRNEAAPKAQTPLDRLMPMRGVCVRVWWWWEGLPYVHVVGVDVVPCLPVSVGLRREADAALVVC